MSGAFADDPIAFVSGVIFWPTFIITWIACASMLGPLGVFFGWLPGIVFGYIAIALVPIALVLLAILIAVGLVVGAFVLLFHIPDVVNWIWPKH